MADLDAILERRARIAEYLATLTLDEKYDFLHCICARCCPPRGCIPASDPFAEGCYAILEETIKRSTT